MEIWERLLEKALRFIENSGIPNNEMGRGNWALGGGTVLAIKYQHRVSKDIDIFLSNPQFLGYFSPRLNEMIEEEASNYEEQSEFIKLNLPEGEIDFIAADRLLDKPYEILHKFDKDIPCEVPLEIIAKKTVYRHQRFTQRDFFDLAAVLHNSNEAERQEIGAVIAPYIKTLQERLQRLDSFDGIQTLPNGKIIHEKGKTILEDFFTLMKMEKPERAEIPMSDTQKEYAELLSEGNRISITLPSRGILKGNVTFVKGNNITVQSGPDAHTLNREIIIKEKWPVKLEPPLRKEETLEFAQEKAKELMGAGISALGAKNGNSYDGKIIGTTETYAIQSVTKDLAVLHRLEDLTRAQKGAKVREGENLSIERDAMGNVSVSPYDKQQKEKELERERKLQRGSQQMGPRSR